MTSGALHCPNNAQYLSLASHISLPRADRKSLAVAYCSQAGRSEVGIVFFLSNQTGALRI